MSLGDTAVPVTQAIIVFTILAEFIYLLKFSTGLFLPISVSFVGVYPFSPLWWPITTVLKQNSNYRTGTVLSGIVKRSWS